MDGRRRAKTAVTGPRARRSIDDESSEKLSGGLLDGPAQNVMNIKPPMCFGEADADVFVAALDDVLSNNVEVPPRGGHSHAKKAKKTADPHMNTGGFAAY